MTPSAADVLALAEDCRERLAAARLTPAAAKLYSQHTRLRFQQPGLTNWTAGDAAQRLDDAVRLLDAGLTLRTAGRGTYRDCLRRAGELLEWLSHPGVGLGNPPVRLLSAATYLLAGYPARADALLRSGNESDPESLILRAFLRGDMPRTLSALTDHWALPGSLDPLNPVDEQDQGGEKEWRSWVVGETLRAIGVACAAMRWEGETRFPAAIEKLRAVATLMAHGRDRYSWLLAKLCAEVATEYRTTSMRGLLREFGQRMSGNGQSALERYCRLAYMNRKLLAWPSQHQGIVRLGQSGSFALCTPTGSGKTTVAELAILQALFEERANGSLIVAIAPLALYLVPSRALAAEVESKLHGVLRRLSDERVIVTGLYGGTDWGPTDAWLTAEDRTVLICTYEKAEALMRFLGPLFVQRISLVVLDEAHSVQFDGRREQLRNAESRALRLEALGMRLFHLVGRGSCRIIALSAVASGIDDALQRWVSGNATDTPVRTSYRSTRQLIGRLECQQNHRFSIHYDLLDGASLEFGGQAGADTPFIPQPFPPYPPAPDWDNEGPEVRLRPPLLWAALHLAAPDDSGTRHGVLISITQRIGDYAEDFLTLLTETWGAVELPNYFARPQDAEQVRLWERCLRSCEDYFGADSSEYRLLERGIVVHHGNMPALLGRLLVEVVQRGITTVVVATSTLSEGVNLPLETILIPTILRSGHPMPAREFANLAGRAGRPGVGTEGRTLVLLPAPLRRGPDLPRQRYRDLIRDLASAARPASGSSVSPLSELLADIWDGWRALTHSDDRSRFLEWLEVTAPAQIQRQQQGPLPSALEALDTLDGLLLSAVVENEEVIQATTAEQQLQELWQSSFAAIAQVRVGQQEEFLRRGVALRSTIYPESAERRRLYRTGLPPCSAYQLLALYPTIREALRLGTAYASWTHAEKLVYIDRIVGHVGSIDRFRYQLRQNKRAFDWHRVLTWWLAPAHATHAPTSRQRASWFEYANKNFGYRFTWGLGSVLGLICDDLHGEQLLALRLEDWPRTELPWVVFWLKELITWGTLEPMAAYLLGRGLADTRTAAEAFAAQYARDIVEMHDADPYDATIIRAWAEQHVQPVPDAPALSLPREFPADPVLDFSEQHQNTWRVLPVPTPQALLWVDPAGYVLAKSTPREDWPTDLLNSTDFFLDPIRRLVTSSRYF